MSKCVITIDRDDLADAINALKMVCFEGVNLRNAYLCREQDDDLNDAYESLLSVMEIFDSVEKVADLDCDSGKFTPRVSKEIAEQIYKSKGDQAGQVKKELFKSMETDRIEYIENDKPESSAEETIETDSCTTLKQTNLLYDLSDEDAEKLYDAILNADIEDDEDCQCEECLSEDEQTCLNCGEPMSDRINDEVDLKQLLENTIIELAGEMLGQVNAILSDNGKNPLKEISFTKDNDGQYVAHVR